MKVPISKLKFGVNRPQSWIDEHPKFMLMQEKLKKSMSEDGLLYPLIITKDYVVTVGNQRLLAAMSLGWNEIECVFEQQATREQRSPPNAKEYDPDRIK